MKGQVIIRWLSIIYLWELMLLAGITFYLSKDLVILTSFAERTGLTFTYFDFSLFSFLGAIIAPLIALMKKEKYYIKRSIYILCGLPLGFFSVPYAVWLVASHNYAIGLAVYLNIFASFIIIAWATYRSTEKK